MTPTVQHFLPQFCFNSRRKLDAIRGVVLHYFSGRWQFPTRKFDKLECYHLLLDLNLPREQREWYEMPSSERRQYASYHFMIHRDGELWQLLPAGQVAYHAGPSEWRGLSNLNNHTLGIALVGDGETLFTVEQYATCAKLCRGLMARYEFNDDWIVGHDQVAPGRKSDPGPLWHQGTFASMLQEEIGEKVHWV